jgi:hypothetical protein
MRSGAREYRKQFPFEHHFQWVAHCDCSSERPRRETDQRDKQASANAWRLPLS